MKSSINVTQVVLLHRYVGCQMWQCRPGGSAFSIMKDTKGVVESSYFVTKNC